MEPVLRSEQPLPGRVGNSSARVATTTAVQILVLVALVFLWSGDSDATATTTDWSFVGLAAGSPAALAFSFVLGRSARPIAPPVDGELVVVARGVHAVTAIGLAVAAVTTPLLVLGEIVFGPMG